MKNKEKKEKKVVEKEKKNKNRDASQIFVRIMAGFLAALMILATASTFIYYIINL